MMTGLFHVRGVVIWQVVVASFYPDVLDLPSLVRIRCATSAQLILKQQLDLLQPVALGLRQAAVDEEEAQQRKASI